MVQELQLIVEVFLIVSMIRWGYLLTRCIPVEIKTPLLEDGL